MLRKILECFGGILCSPAKLQVVPGWRLGVGERYRSPVMSLRRFMWRNITEPFLVNWLNGTKVQLSPPSEIARAVFFTGLYEPNEMLFLREFVKPGMTVIDVGANEGFYSIYLASLVGAMGRVISLEPSKREADRLRANIRINKLQNVSVRQVAIGRQNTSGLLHVADSAYSGHNTLGGFGYNHTKELHVERVTIIKLDSIVADENACPDLLKMDIEGAEAAALLGAESLIRSHHPAFLIEVSERSLVSQGASAKEVYDLLRGHDYILYRFSVKSGLPEIDERVSCPDSENIIAIWRKHTGINTI